MQVVWLMFLWHSEGSELVQRDSSNGDRNIIGEENIRFSLLKIDDDIKLLVDRRGIAVVEHWLVVLCLSFFREIPIYIIIVLLLTGDGGSGVVADIMRVPLGAMLLL